jgi:hypothetical protein
MPTVPDETGVKMDFEKLYLQMSTGGIGQMERKVLTGKEKLPVRLMISLLPEEVYAGQIRNREREAKKKGRTVSDETRIFYRLIDRPMHKIMPREVYI